MKMTLAGWAKLLKVHAPCAFQRTQSNYENDSWNARPGNKYIRARKYVKGPTELMYSSSEKEYNLHSEDVRAINMKHKKIEVRRSNRQPIASNKVTILLDEGELGELKLSCWVPPQNDE